MQLRLALAIAAALAVPSAFAQSAAADSRLVVAMKARDVATVRELAAEGVGIDVQDAESATALHWAAHWNDLESVRALLRAGANPNFANRFGVTPLHEAATVRNGEMLKLMLEAGGNANAEFGEGETVLMSAARAGDAASVAALLAHGGNVDAAERWHGQTALMWAAMENHADVVSLLLEAGADLNRTSTKHDWVKISYSEGNVPKDRDLGGLTALQFAARQGSLEAVETLLDAGADATLEEPMYRLTALQLAVVNGHYTLAKRMIERGVDVDDGSLYLAVDTRNLPYFAQRPNPPEKDGEVTSLDVIAALLERGANPDLPYAKGIPERTVAGTIPIPAGATPLDRAAAAGDFAAVETLLEHGASATVTTEDGTTPLMLLAGYSRQRNAPFVANDPKRLELIRTLLEKGADVHAVHKDSTNDALYFAKQRNAPEIVALLEEFAARQQAASR
jgi:ankyrin repeat protein